MHRLIRVAMLEAFLLLLLVSASVLIGRQQPGPAVIRFLHLTDCAPPCWIGIVPGKTTLDEARERIQAVYGSMPGIRLAYNPGFEPVSLPVHIIRQDNPMGIITIGLNTRGDNIIYAIVLDFRGVDRQDLVVLGDFYALYGAPPFVALLEPGINSPNDLALVYGDEERGAVVFAPPARSLPWTQDIGEIIFYAENGIPLARSAELRPWRGYGKLTYLGR